MTRRAGPGKWPTKDLARLLARYAAAAGPDVPVGPDIGVDAAVVRVGGGQVVVATDPVTFATDNIGWYAVTVNANDMAALGARPRMFVAAVLVPPQSRPTVVESIFADIADACRTLGVLLVGGHTERTAGLPRPIVCGTMLGDLEGRRPLSAGGARAGDCVILTKGAAIEATALVARERGKALRPRLGARLLARARRFLVDPGISIVPEALIARDHGARALHDVTEGGVATGLWELAEASGLGLDVEADAIPILPETRGVCDAAGIDPLEAIGSGALLVAAPPRAATGLLAALAEAGIGAAVVGRLTRRGGRRRIRSGGRWRRLVPPAVDAVARLFA
jgi:hydrogenase maturation factor